MVNHCILQDKFTRLDVTELAKTIVKGIQELIGQGRRANNYTLLYFLDIFKGREIGLYSRSTLLSSCVNFFFPLMTLTVVHGWQPL